MERNYSIRFDLERSETISFQPSLSKNEFVPIKMIDYKIFTTTIKTRRGEGREMRTRPPWKKNFNQPSSHSSSIDIERHSQIYTLSLSLSLDSTQSRKKATPSNQTIRPVESSSTRSIDEEPGQGDDGKEGKGREEGREKVGVLLARSDARGIHPHPHPRSAKLKIGKAWKREGCEARRFWAAPDPFNELVIAFWAGHPSQWGRVERWNCWAVFCFCCPRSTTPSLSAQHPWEAGARRDGCDHPWAASKSREGEGEWRIWISCRWRLLYIYIYMWVTG